MTLFRVPIAVYLFGSRESYLFKHTVPCMLVYNRTGLPEVFRTKPPTGEGAENEACFYALWGRHLHEDKFSIRFQQPANILQRHT